MNWSNKSILLLLVVCASPLQAKPKTNAEKENDIPTPPGYTDKGVKIPLYEDGKLQMFFNMETAFRLNKGHLQMTNLTIETFDEAGKPDLKINMPTSLLDIDANVISSAAPVTIHRSDFEVTGTHMTFNTQTREGKFSGPARMLIFNNGALGASPPKHEAAKETPAGGTR